MILFQSLKSFQAENFQLKSCLVSKNKRVLKTGEFLKLVFIPFSEAQCNQMMRIGVDNTGIVLYVILRFHYSRFFLLVYFMKVISMMLW